MRLINPDATDVTPVIPSAVEDPSPAGDAASTQQQHATQPDTSKHVHQAVGVKRRAEANQMFSSAKSAHAIHPPAHQTLSQLRVEMEMQWRRRQMLEWRQGRCKVAQREPIRHGRIVQTRSYMEACPNTVGECRRCDADEVLATVAGVRSEPT